jgi:hypothetical protein
MTFSWVHSISQWQHHRFAPLHRCIATENKTVRSRQLWHVKLPVHTCSSRDVNIPLMRRLNTNSAPNMPVTFLRNNFWYVAWSRVPSTLSRYGVTERVNVTSVDPVNKFWCCTSDKILINKQIMKTVWFDELPPFPVGSFTYRNEQARAEDVQRVIVYKLNRYPQRRRLRVASGATAPGPAQERAPRFRHKFVLISLSS